MVISRWRIVHHQKGRCEDFDYYRSTVVFNSYFFKQNFPFLCCCLFTMLLYTYDVLNVLVLNHHNDEHPHNRQIIFLRICISQMIDISVDVKWNYWQYRENIEIMLLPCHKCFNVRFVFTPSCLKYTCILKMKLVWKQ
jgi:hypothetical protein